MSVKAMSKLSALLKNTDPSFRTVSLIPSSSMLQVNGDYCCVCLCVQDHPVSKTSQVQRSGAEGHGCFWTDHGLSLCEQ